MELVIKETLENLLKVLGISFSSVTVAQEDGEKAYCAQIETDQSSLLIGWHGETIAALQHMLKSMLYKQGVQPNTQVVVDVDGYKKRQEESVVRLAERKAEYACDTGKPVTLPAMNPYFRRKVHTHLTHSERFKNALTTESVGQEPNRCVRIVPK